MLKVHKWLSWRSWKKVSGVPDKDWVGLLSLWHTDMSPKVYECFLPVTVGGYTFAYFLSFMGVMSKALKINSEALQRIYLCHSGFINHYNGISLGMLATRLWSLVEVEIILKWQEEARGKHGTSFGLLLLCPGYDTEDGYFFSVLIRQMRLWGTIIQSLGCDYIGMLLAQKLAVFSVNF